MNREGQIIIIEDDQDDQLFLELIFKNLNYENEVLYFEDGEKALEYLVSTDAEPFIILSDVNMPILSGLELRDKIYNNERLRIMCIPYLFFSTNAEQQHVIDAYSKSIQGFFIKPNSIEKLEITIRKIIEYWKECVSPNYIK